MHESNPGAEVPSGSALARLLGIEELRVGGHYLRDADRARIGHICVQSLWYAEIVPSFHTPSILCVARAEGLPFRDVTAPSWHRAVFATPARSAVVSIELDPVADSLNSLSAFHPRAGLSIDGVWYKVAFETTQLRGTLAFGNPSQPSIVALQSALHALASQVACSANLPELQHAVAVWKEYIDGQG